MPTLPIQEEVLKLVKDHALFPEFSDPVIAAVGTSIDDPAVLSRLAYNQIPQNILKVGVWPYLYWTGPFNYNSGQVANGFSATKKADFWFYCTHNTVTEAMAWTDAIEAAVKRIVVPYVLTKCRIVGMIFIDKMPVIDDQTIKTSQEFPMSRATIGYRFAYQASDN